jgi:hypothetical protein
MRIRWTHAFLPVVIAGALACAAGEAGESPTNPDPGTPNVTVLTNDVEIPASNGIYKISVPPGQAYVLVIARGQNGMVMDVASGQPATSTYFACHETQKDTNDQVCPVNKPNASDYYITLSNVTSSSARIKASYVPDLNTNLLITTLKSGVAQGSQAQTEGKFLYYQIFVPSPASGTQKLEVKLSGGSGDADMYVGRGVSPELTKLSVLCTSATPNTNTETCTINPPVLNDYYYIAIKATKLFIGASITATVGATTTTTPPPTGSGCQAQWGTTLAGTWTATSYVIIAAEYIPSFYRSVTYDFGTTGSYKATYTTKEGTVSNVTGSFTVATSSTANSVGGNKCEIRVPVSGGTIVMEIQAYSGGVLELRDNGNPGVPVFIKMKK